MAQVSLEGLTLHVTDLERSLAFYNRLPGAVVEFHKPGLFAMVRIGRGRLGLLQRAAGRFHIELEVDDLDGFYDEAAPGRDRAQGAARPASLGRARLPGRSTRTDSSSNSRRLRTSTNPSPAESPGDNPDTIW